MSERVFTDGDAVLYAPVAGAALKKFKVTGAVKDDKTREWKYKIKSADGTELKDIEEKKLTMD